MYTKYKAVEVSRAIFVPFTCGAFYEPDNPNRSETINFNHFLLMEKFKYLVSLISKLLVLFSISVIYPHLQKAICSLVWIPRKQFEPNFCFLRFDFEPFTAQ